MEAKQPFQTETLLIVDDEPLVTDLYRQYMTKRGFGVLTADCGAEAIRLLEDPQHSVDLVITDMTMPDMDGATLARCLQDKWPRIPMIIATGHDLDQDTMQLPPNVVEVVRKPFQNKALFARIREILDRSQ